MSLACRCLNLRIALRSSSRWASRVGLHRLAICTCLRCRQTHSSGFKSGVSGQPFQPNGSARFFQQGFYSAAAMNWRAIPDDQQPLVDRLLQMPQKPGCEEAVDRGFMRLESAATIRCDSTDHRQMLPRLPFPKDWCLPAGSPRRSHCRKWIEA